MVMADLDGSRSSQSVISRASIMARCLASMSPLAIFIITILAPLSCAGPSPASQGLETRTRREETLFSGPDITEIVDLHNYLRFRHGSSNMGYMVRMCFFLNVPYVGAYNCVCSLACI